MAAGAVSYANCSVAAGANTHVKGFADTCHKNKKSVAKGITSKGIASESIVLKDVLCHKNKKGKQKRKKVITSLVKVKLRRLRRDTVIISLSLTSVSASLLFVQTYCSSS
jgi:hypothetical protein